ncbi:DUF397 domain-containing protein [Streptomyces sp. NBC_00264]|uniref:DUF397 domain-containing protein n=1 Tax=unclassified Streptomyces TaxID=2593676 RepID=UPI00224DD4C0|nr:MULTISPECIES: DUF397 domain-containing protein [unclassified Streptomyces]MCX4396513.1 DUF397 domain-containing protein [Streptomyces sp. NBC_01767]MCX5160361.1 DUF397 domain-containing protein [Streptomyces sp. NBC_00305]MCX5218884.1 DUF397 domain-containing protein [Streptomyces sp. NBC_00264]WSX01589.1 DUF397 domain-containing protein [Streptomyces sp. NBC_00987]
MNEGIISDASTLSGWRKSSYSNSESGSCVEVLDGHPSGVPVRDSKNPRGPVLIFTADGWSSFVAAFEDQGFPV